MTSIAPDSDENQDLKIKDSFFAPWGLPTEELPMHVLWEGSTDVIIIDIPPEFSVLEAHNLDGMSIDEVFENGRIRFKENELATAGYFGLILEDENKYDEPTKSHGITISFTKDGVTQKILEKTTHIIRPEIRVQNAPDEITLTDENIPDIIELDMEYIGFGMAQVAIEAEAEGEFISEGESLLHDLLQAILDTELHKQDVESIGPIPNDWKDDSDVEVPPEEIEEIVRDMSALARSGEFSEEYDTDELMEIADALEEAEEMADPDSGLAAILYRFIETALLSSILNVVDRHPTENVSLDNPTTKIHTRARTTEVQIHIHLRDNLENEYGKETVFIDVHDEREEESGHFESEITTNWENFQVDPDEVFANE